MWLLEDSVVFIHCCGLITFGSLSQIFTSQHIKHSIVTESCGIACGNSVRIKFIFFAEIIRRSYGWNGYHLYLVEWRYPLNLIRSQLNQNNKINVLILLVPRLVFHFWRWKWFWYYFTKRPFCSPFAVRKVFCVLVSNGLKRKQNIFHYYYSFYTFGYISPMKSSQKVSIWFFPF